MPAITKVATVHQANAYRNIITNFSDPLEVVREAVSNAIDAKATKVRILIDEPIGPAGTRELRLRISDDGHGMSEDRLARFFNLGDSEKGDLKRDGGDNHDGLPIGEKGFGTKIYLNSRKVDVVTTDAKSGLSFRATSAGHSERLFAGEAPEYSYETVSEEAPGTHVTITGYNQNDGSLFNHDRVRDYVQWFTKFGSFEAVLWSQKNAKATAIDERLRKLTLDLRGLGFDPARHGPDFDAKHESISFGHPFPEECFEPAKVKEKAKSSKSSYTDVFCRRFVYEGSLKDHPGVRYQAVFSIEGNRVKYSNPMVRRQGYKAPEGAYKVADRYGIWLCKDFIPVEQANFLVNERGSEFTKFHAFFNCQELRLSADRTSIGPTNPKIKAAVYAQIKEKAREIMEEERVQDVLTAFDEEERGERTTDQEKKLFARRLAHVKSASRAQLEGLELLEPRNEQGVVALVAQLLVLKESHLPFRVLDWNGSEGLDILARDSSDLTLEDASKFYVECKHTATSTFNHSFSNVKYIVCWTTQLENQGEVTGVGGDKRKVVIKTKTDKQPYTQYYLSRDDANSIELIVLDRYLRERLACEFK